MNRSPSLYQGWDADVVLVWYSRQMTMKSRYSSTFGLPTMRDMKSRYSSTFGLPTMRDIRATTRIGI
jgi:hypothetical protein